MKINVSARDSLTSLADRLGLALALAGHTRHLRTVSMTLTLILLAVCTVVAVVAGWRGARPPDLLRGPRMMPWRFLMLFAGALASLLLIHLTTLLGVHRAE
ncbi:hypothetical protein BH10PSE2_BH10PSE2_01230 [soil metagenome]